MNDPTIENNISPTFSARHEPNPCDQNTSPEVAQPPFPFMWYYRTEVMNTGETSLRITEFECYVRHGGRWVAGNLRGRPLTGVDFAQWYAGAGSDGTIAPGATAVCRLNWHGRPRPWSSPVRWVYQAVDHDGNSVETEATVQPVPIRNEQAVAWGRRHGSSVVIRGMLVALMAAFSFWAVGTLSGTPLSRAHLVIAASLGFLSVATLHLLTHTERGAYWLQSLRKLDPASSSID